MNSDKFPVAQITAVRGRLRDAQGKNPRETVIHIETYIEDVSLLLQYTDKVIEEYQHWLAGQSSTKSPSKPVCDCGFAERKCLGERLGARVKHLHDCPVAVALKCRSL